ncbi:MAG TPA: agmatinase [Planctomycetota bacterium]|nr:agmatinase [Planctomycetota bacterium]
MEEACHFPCFLGIGPPHSSYESAGAAILPVPFEATTSYVKGTRRGPQAILDASHQVELYDEELGRETYRLGITTLPTVEVDGLAYGQAAERIAAAARRPLADGKLLVALGGEHSITPPLVEAAAGICGPLTVLQLDAHADLRDAYDGTPHSHACALRRIRERHDAVQVGIRALSADEAGLIRDRNYPVFFAHEMAADPAWADRALALLGGQVYLTIDLDAFDPSVVPAVGTPEPGGMGWYETLRFLRRVAAQCRIVAMDVVELCPVPGSIVSDFAAAKLTYRLIGYILGG